MPQETMTTEKTETALQSPWVWSFLIFMLVVFAANGLLIYFAYRSQPSLVAADFYERGRNFEARTGMERRMKADLGWTMAFGGGFAPVAGRAAPLAVGLTGATDAAAPDSVTLYAYRPSDAAYDFSLPLRPRGNGTFAADAAFPLKGAWDIIVEAKKGDRYMNIARRITVAEHGRSGR